jgi:Domain of unknown function (DUF4129)
VTDHRVTVAACLLVALASAVAASTTGIERQDVTSVTEGGPEPREDPADRTEEGTRSATADDPDASDRDRGAFRLTLPGVAVGLLVLALAVLVLAVVARIRLVVHRRRRLDATGLRGPPGVPPTDEEASEKEVAEALEAGITALAAGSARNAVVAAWVALEDAAARAGVPGEEADTATDLVRRMLAAHPVDQAALELLATLYREARFSGHELTERHRRQAGRCLEQLRHQLGGVAR